jgi:hypothetical protein
MGSFFTNILAKIFGKTFISRAATTVVVFLSGLIGQYLPALSPELLERWSSDTVEIISLLFGLALGLLIDSKMAQKPETPKIVK